MKCIKRYFFQILLLGMLQTIIESVMYIFVFMWTPVLMPAQPPLGMGKFIFYPKRGLQWFLSSFNTLLYYFTVFACFMVAIMIGSSIFSLLLAKGFRAEATLRIILVIIALSMVICCLTAKPGRSTQDMIITYIG